MLKVFNEDEHVNRHIYNSKICEFKTAPKPYLDSTRCMYLCVFFLTAGYLVYEFDKFWFEEKPESIMYFNVYREKFHEKIKGLLLDCNVSLTLKI